MAWHISHMAQRTGPSGNEDVRGNQTQEAGALGTLAIPALATILRKEPNTMWGSHPHAGLRILGHRGVCKSWLTAITGQGLLEAVTVVTGGLAAPDPLLSPEEIRPTGSYVCPHRDNPSFS